MDPFFHFFISFSGGYIILAELYKKPKIKEALILSFIAAFIDIDHIVPFARILSWFISNGSIPTTKFHLFHNIFTVLLLLAVSKFLLKKEFGIYGYTLSVMLFGHLLFDMTRDVGITLFFPFSNNLYMIPPDWGIRFVGNSYILENFGIAMLLYFAAVFLAILLIKNMSGKKHEG